METAMRPDQPKSSDAPETPKEPERFPATRSDDSVEASDGESRSFDPPRRGDAGKAAIPPAPTDGRLGPAGDPAEGKR
jgi:hypothetical protein